MIGLALAVLAQAAPAPAAPDAHPAPSVYAARRQKLVLPSGAIAILRAAPDPDDTMTDPYRPGSDFYYMTGFEEPDGIAVLKPGAPEGERYWLFVRGKNLAEEQWTGYRLGPDAARGALGAEKADASEHFFEKLPELLKGVTSLHLSDGGDLEFRAQVLKAFAKAGSDSATERPVLDLGPLVHEMRLVKDPVEIGLLRRAASLSADAHKAALQKVGPGRYEYGLKAAMVATCLEGGSARMAYPPIVGSGLNSVILHYDRDDKRMEAGEMIVNDTACEYGRYAADVTRSYPVSGTFSPEQKAIYEIVLEAQKAGFAKVKPGVTVAEVYKATVDVVVDGLLKLGILQGTREALIASREFRKFYPHGSGHWLGLDVHDAGSYSFDPDAPRQDRYFTARTVLKPGMALTVEPGIYIPEASTADKKWWNLGVRIEDDVLVTETGMDCLSCAAPREVKDVEAALRRKN
jgi:Xaa-Pro aminopeptidase